ncbi:hypothetical protein F4778DRAFT_749615, partial [Xylariomycetidae sp. FL2044]
MMLILISFLVIFVMFFLRCLGDELADDDACYNIKSFLVFSSLSFLYMFDLFFERSLL